MYSQVAEFHAAIGLPRQTEPRLPNAIQRALRMRLLDEEVIEFCDAYAAGQRVAMAKELADVAYILTGTAVVYGLAEGFPQASPFTGWSPMVVFHHTAIDVMLRQYQHSYLAAEADDDLPRIRAEIKWMVWALFSIALQLDIPFNAVFDVVHQSNLTKLQGAGPPRADGKILKSKFYISPEPRIAELMHG
jgi:predicted HAD superfamily Cof-like phosphohydrolase